MSNLTTIVSQLQQIIQEETLTMCAGHYLPMFLCCSLSLFRSFMFRRINRELVLAVSIIM